MDSQAASRFILENARPLERMMDRMICLITRNAPGLSRI